MVVNNKSDEFLAFHVWLGGSPCGGGGSPLFFANFFGYLCELVIGYPHSVYTGITPTERHPMKIIDKMKTFELHEMVVANMTAQGMTEGTEYKVTFVFPVESPAGTYFDYELETASGKWIYIRNGHILLNATSN